MNQTGVWGTGLPRAARRKALSWSGPLAGAVVLMGGSLAGQSACSHIAVDGPT
jgi:hypothetical protein